MMTDDFKAIPYVITALAGMALLFLLLSWALGGDGYFRDVLYGEASLLLLIALTLPGTLVAAWRHYRGRFADDAARQPLAD